MPPKNKETPKLVFAYAAGSFGKNDKYTRPTPEQAKESLAKGPPSYSIWDRVHNILDVACK